MGGGPTLRQIARHWRKCYPPKRINLLPSTKARTEGSGVPSKASQNSRVHPAAHLRHTDLKGPGRGSRRFAELSQAIEQEVEKCPEAKRLRTHPGVGALTALAFVLIIENCAPRRRGRRVQFAALATHNCRSPNSWSILNFFSSTN
jgi:hypothetical protein